MTSSANKDFWLSCGHHLLDRDPGGGLALTDDFLKVYLARPELTPPTDACVVERTLHAALLADPRRPVRADEIAAIADPDARENWTTMLAFRDRIVAHRTVEAAYADLIRNGVGRTPPMFVNQLVHVILRNVLDGCDDSFMLRAGELFFREQRMTVHDGSLLAADEETIGGIGDQPLSPLVSMMGLPAAAEIDVLNTQNADTYWERSDRFDTALDLTAGRAGLAALGRVIGAWVWHMLGIEVEVTPLTEMRDVSLTWYVGLDTYGTQIGDALWRGEPVDRIGGAQVVGLFRLSFADPAVMSEAVRGAPVFLILAMTPERLLRLKPQNLLTGLPIKQRETIS
jgi:hypothetical protein